MKNLTVIFVVACLLIIAGCSNSDPGPLSGTWKMSGAMPMTVKYRRGETEAMGIIEKVAYKVEGRDVLVTYTDGIAKGMTIRYTMINANTARSELGNLHRISR